MKPGQWGAVVPLWCNVTHWAHRMRYIYRGRQTALWVITPVSWHADELFHILLTCLNRLMTAGSHSSVAWEHFQVEDKKENTTGVEANPKHTYSISNTWHKGMKHCTWLAPLHNVRFKLFASWNYFIQMSDQSQKPCCESLQTYDNGQK